MSQGWTKHTSLNTGAPDLVMYFSLLMEKRCFCSDSLWDDCVEFETEITLASGHLLF